MKIIVDAMGGDNAPYEIVEAAVRAVNEIGVSIILVGKEEIIKEELNKHKIKNNDLIEIQNAQEVILNEDSPAMAIKKKKDSSMVVGLNLLKEGKGDGFISAGNTGALMAGTLLIVKRIKGVDRPALAPVVPTKEGATLLIDAGSNVDCKPINLVQFAVMGSIYMKKAFGINAPRVGLLNVGEEEKKGNELTKQSYELLKELNNINFIGNIEGRDVPLGKSDVTVCDGFSGNIVLKVMEGMGLTIVKFLKEELTRNFFTKLGALISKSAFKNLKKKMNYKEYGGALLVGVNGTVIKAHGSSDAKLFFNTIKQAQKLINSGFVEEIKDEIHKMEDNK